MWGDELNISTYRCSYNQRQMALSNESIKFYCQAKLCDLAILNSPTSYDDTELTYYLVDELRRHGYTNFYTRLGRADVAGLLQHRCGNQAHGHHQSGGEVLPPDV